MLQMLYDRKANALREETEGKLQMLFSPRKDGLDFLFKEVRAFKVPKRVERVRDTIRTFPKNMGNLPVWDPPPPILPVTQIHP